MPMYLFHCPKCGRKFEELLTMQDKDTAYCPTCGAAGEREWMGKRNSLSPVKKTTPACEHCARACPHAKGR